MGDSRKRVLDVLAHRQPDRVPIYEALIDPPMVEYILGVQGKNSAMLEPEQLVRLHTGIGLDGIVCGLKLWRPTAQLAGRRVPVEQIVPPAPAEIDHCLSRAQETARLAHQEGLAVAAYTHGCFDVLYESLGFENFMLLLYDDYDYIRQLSDALFSHHLAGVRAALQTGVDWIVIGDDVAFKTGLLISPEMFMDLWYDKEALMVRTAREAGRQVEFHSDGKVDFILPHLIEMGVALLNPVEPYSNDIRRIKHRYGDRIALRGNLDIAGALAFGTPRECYNEARALLRDMMPGGNYVCSTSHSISSAVRPENYLQVVKAVREHGVY